MELMRLKITKTPEEFAREIANKLQQIRDYSESLQQKYSELMLGFQASSLKSKFYSEILNEAITRINSSKAFYQGTLEEEIENAFQNYSGFQ